MSQQVIRWIEIGGREIARRNLVQGLGQILADKTAALDQPVLLGILLGDLDELRVIVNAHYLYCWVRAGDQKRDDSHAAAQVNHQALFARAG